MNQKQPGVRPLRKNEIRVAAHMLAESFDDDPLFQWFGGESLKNRKAILRWFHESALNECFGVDGVFTLDEDSGPERGVVAMIPPGRWPLSFFRTLAATLVPRVLTGRLIRGGLHIEKEIRSRHPPEKHVYVYVLGVHPTMKGKGLGAQLMRHACAIAKENDCVVHLETSNPINLPFYRRFDLEIQHEITGYGGPSIWTMTQPRPPGSAA
jgi:ribosomal protein S18 acetylase RimI-like enzyme